jgi:TPR repeat protein
MRRSLSNGSGNHMLIYGTMLATFGGDPHEGMMWMHKSAEAGFAPGMMMWAVAELSGKNGIAQNKADAEQWMLKAAKTGSAVAQMALGHLYIDGTFGKPDVQTGLHWLQQAAKQGYPRAEGALGALLVMGNEGVPRNPAKGVEWAEKAAAQQNAFGYYALGYAYEHGAGKPVDPEKAWYNFAAAQRVDIQHELPTAADAMSKVATRLSSAQVTQLQAEVAKIPVPKERNQSNSAQLQ